MPRKALTGRGTKVFREGLSTGRKAIQQAEKLARPGEQMKQYERAFNLAQQQLAPMQGEMRRQFTQEEAPQLIAQFGGNARSSSALNQALAAAMTNLNQRMQSSTMQLASDIAGQEMQNRMNMTQFNAGLGQQMLGVNPYLPSSGAPSATKQAIGHGLNLAAQAAGTYFSGGNPAAGKIAGTGMSMLTSKLTGGNATPDLSSTFGGMDFFKNAGTAGN